MIGVFSLVSYKPYFHVAIVILAKTRNYFSVILFFAYKTFLYRFNLIGLLGVGFEKFGSQELLTNNAIKHLFDVSFIGHIH